MVDRAYPMRTDTSINPPTERTRQLTRILDLRVLAGIPLEDGVNYRQWLHSLLLGLRNVRCVLFEDYAPLNADCLLYLSMRHDWYLNGNSRMLVARAMRIPTARYLGPFVLGFGNVSYLDLSKTTCAGDHAFLNMVALSGFFRNVGILKLRNVKLDDQGLHTIISGAARSIWSLDVRDNLLTYQSLVCLLAFSVQRPRHDPGNEYSRYVEEEDQPDRAIKYLSNGRTKGILRETGLTHLKIADNGPFLAQDVGALLASEKLVAVDVGIAWPSRQTSSGRLIPFDEPSAGSAQLRDWIAPPLADPKTYHIGRSMRYVRLHHTFITGQCLGHDDDLDITQLLLSGPEDLERVEAMMAKNNFIWKVAQTGITELVLMDLPAVSRVGFLSRGLQVFISMLARLETEDRRAQEAQDPSHTHHPSEVGTRVPSERGTESLWPWSQTTRHPIAPYTTNRHNIRRNARSSTLGWNDSEDSETVLASRYAAMEWRSGI